MSLSRLVPRPSLGHVFPSPPVLFSYLILGGEAAPPTNDPSQIFSTDPSQPFDAVIVNDTTAPEELRRLLLRSGAWLVPIASLGRIPIPFADYRPIAPGPGTIGDATAALAVILERIQRLPETVRRTAEPHTILLARAYSRNGRLTAVPDPSVKEMMRYPAAGILDAPRTLAERLADAGAFERAFVDRFHVCGACGSSRLNVREECRRCRSANLVEEETIHHFRCAYQGLEREFATGDALICPKCRRTLRHIGVDYDKPGIAVACRDCGHVEAEAAVGFRCLDCGAAHHGEQITTRDWHAYSLTPLGERWLMDSWLHNGGALPHGIGRGEAAADEMIVPALSAPTAPCAEGR